MKRRTVRSAWRIRVADAPRASRARRQSSTLAAAHSMMLSRPKPTSTTLDARMPDQSARPASTAL